MYKKRDYELFLSRICAVDRKIAKREKYNQKKRHFKYFE